MNPNPVVITRADIQTILKEWQAGKLTAKDVHEWAEFRYMNDDFDHDDWEGEDDVSVANEVMSALDKLNMDLVVSDDIPHYLEFLKTPPGRFAGGLKKLSDSLKTIDMKSRAQLLRTDPLYSVFANHVLKSDID